MNTTAHNTQPWKSRMTDLQAELRRDFAALKGDQAGRLAAQHYLNNSTALYHGQVVGMGYLPKLYDTAALAHFEHLVHTTYTILDKLTQACLKDAEYRRLFRFSPLLERLLTLPVGYDCTIPIARIDIFLHEDSGDFAFCEFNTDGSSAMNEDREICDALAGTPLLKRFGLQHQVCAQELFDPWVETFLALYEGWPLAVPEPTVAIVDYVASATLHEHQEFRRRFERQGVNCLVVDMPSLVFEDGALYATDLSQAHPAHRIPLRIDAIYRRAVTFEIVRELEQLPAEELEAAFAADGTRRLRGAAALVAAVAAQKVCLIGSFRTQVAHSKAIYCLMHHPASAAFLTAREQEFIAAHVPFTTWLEPGSLDLAAVKAERERWIIKPVDGYGTQGVHAGKSLSPAEWSALIDEKLTGGELRREGSATEPAGEKLTEAYVIQEYYPQLQTLGTLPVPQNSAGEPLFSTAEEADAAARQGDFVAEELLPFNTLTGLFAYAGKLAGVYVRAGQDALIVGFRGGVTLGSLFVDHQTDHQAGHQTTGHQKIGPSLPRTRAFSDPSLSRTRVFSGS